MTAALLFLVVGIGLYFAAAWLLERIESRLGHPLEHRSLIYFAILLALALATFWLIQTFAPA